jgi:hypothetical protein
VGCEGVEALRLESRGRLLCNEPAGCMKRGEHLDQLSYYQLLAKDVEVPRAPRGALWNRGAVTGDGMSVRLSCFTLAGSISNASITR